MRGNVAESLGFVKVMDRKNAVFTPLKPASILKVRSFVMRRSGVRLLSPAPFLVGLRQETPLDLAVFPRTPKIHHNLRGICEVPRSCSPASRTAANDGSLFPLIPAPLARQSSPAPPCKGRAGLDCQTARKHSPIVGIGTYFTGATRGRRCPCPRHHPQTPSP